MGYGQMSHVDNLATRWLKYISWRSKDPMSAHGGRTMHKEITTSRPWKRDKRSTRPITMGNSDPKFGFHAIIKCVSPLLTRVQSTLFSATFKVVAEWRSQVCHHKAYKNFNISGELMYEKTLSKNPSLIFQKINL